MKRATVAIDDMNAGRRLDAFVRQLLPEVPLGTLMKWMRTGGVRVNGARSKPSARLALGDEVAYPAAVAAAQGADAVGPVAAARARAAAVPAAGHATGAVAQPQPPPTERS